MDTETESMGGIRQLRMALAVAGAALVMVFVAVFGTCFMPTPAFAATADMGQNYVGSIRVVGFGLGQTTMPMSISALDAEVDGTVDGGNGWVLEYTFVDDNAEEAVIIGYEQAGEGELVIPAEVNDGIPVVSIASSAFYGSEDLTSVVISEGITNLGALYVFGSSTLESITIPASMTRIPYGCFNACKSLASVNFQGAEIRYLGNNAFSGCTALEEIEIPLLTDYPNYNIDGKTDGDEISFNTTYYDSSASVGANCFYGCTSLTRLIFDGPVVSDATNYFNNPNTLSDVPDGLEIIYYSASGSIGTANGNYTPSVTYYYTLDFYGSPDDADTDSYDNQIGSLTVRAAEQESSQSSTERLIRLFDLLYDRDDYSDNVYEGSIPALPEGKVWGIVGSTDFNDYSYMARSYRVAAVDPSDMKYGWVNSPSIDAVNSQTGSTTGMGGGPYQGESTTADVSFYMKADGTIPELYEVYACSTDGALLDPSIYTLVFEQAIIGYEQSGNGNYHEYIESWDEIDVDAITETGLYRVSAKGVGDYEETQTAPVSFNVARSVPTTTTYYRSDNLSKHLGYVAYDAARNINKSEPAYTVIVPAGDWRNQLLGAGFAGAGIGKGILLTDCGYDQYGDYIYDSEMMQAFNLVMTYSSARSYIMMGNEEAVPQSIDTHDQVYLADYVENARNQSGASSGYATRYGADATTAQELATSAISTFRADRWGAEWGTTALVASSSEELITESATEYAYLNACRVFYLCDDGTIAQEDLDTLADDSIEQIVLVGDTNCVSASVEATIADDTGKTPTRILTESSSTIASIELARQLVADKTASWSTLVIADTTGAGNVSNAAVLAGSVGGVMIPCSTTADVKEIEALVEQLIWSTNELATITDIRVVGEFAYVDGGGDALAEQLANIWNIPYTTLNTNGSWSIDTGDTFEVSGYIFETTGATTAKLSAYTGGASEAGLRRTVDYNNVTYTIEGVEVDLSALEAAVTTAGDVINESFTSSSWAAFENALASARDVLADVGCSQLEADSAAAALDAAREALEAVDKSALQGTISRYDGIDLSNFTPGTRSALEDALDYGKSVLENTDAGQSVVDAADTAIKDAVDNLKTLFRDVANEDAWYFDAVYNMVDLGAITGYNSSTFGVGDPMMRKDFVTVMWRYCEPEEYATYNEATAQNTSGLPDVASGQYYTGAVNWAVSSGVVTGNRLADGSYVFAPDDPITFEQMITIVARYAVGSGRAAAWDTTALDTGPFTDAASVSGFARGPMSWAIEKDLVTGNQISDNLYSLDPLENVARERVVTVLWRGIDNGSITAQ